MKRLHLLFILLFVISLTHLTHGQVAKTVACSAGNLSTIASSYLSTVTNLTVTGTIDARDFKTMRDKMVNLDTIDLSGAIIMEYTGTEGTFSTNTTTYQANAIPDKALINTNASKTKLKTFIYPANITKIGDNAFDNCFNITGTLILPTSLTTIGNSAFYNCDRLSSLILPQSLTTIGNSAFFNCEGLRSLILPSSLTSIGSDAFKYCSGITGLLEIPSALNTIGDLAFRSCQVTFKVEVGNANYSSSEGVLFNKNKTILIKCPESKTGNYTIPSTVVIIKPYAFSDCNKLTGSLIIPSSVTTIGSSAFYNCRGFTGALVIPSSVTTIESYAFLNCTGLTETISISANTTTIDGTAFLGCRGLFKVDANNPNYSSSTDGILFNKTKTELISCPTEKSGFYTIPATVKTIGYRAFYWCTKLKGINILSPQTSISQFAFEGCINLTSLAISNPTPTILDNYNYAFESINKSSCTLFVPQGSKTLYSEANLWKNFETINDTPPTTPILNKLISVTDSNILAKWSTPLDASHYLLDVATDNLFTNTIAGYSNFVIPRDSVYNITGLDPATNYFVRIRASNPSFTSNYSNTLSTSTLKQNQTIIFDSLANRPYTATTFTIVASGGTSGNPIVFTSSNSTIASCTGINGSTINIVGSGTCYINANQAGSETHNAAPTVSQKLTINAGIIYVKPTLESTIWQSKPNVYSSLQEALEHASKGDEIWIAAGTYYPTTDTTRTATFNLIEGISLFGGFAGTETKKEQRNWVTNKTILSGNIGNTTISTDNTYQIISITGTYKSAQITLDGLTIANGYSDNHQGGGIVSKGGNVRVVNCHFDNNHAILGGAIASPKDGTYFNFANTLFTNNSAKSDGAVIYQLNTPSNFYNCIFVNNNCTEEWSKIISSRGEVNNSIIWKNTVASNGLSSYYESYNLNYNNCLIENGPDTNGCISTDPLFVSGGYNLSPNSPCIEKGNTTKLPNWVENDYSGQPRVAGTRVDIGIYESVIGIAPTIKFPNDQRVISTGTIDLNWSYLFNPESVTGFKIELTTDNKSPKIIEVGMVNNYNLTIDDSTQQYSCRVMATHINSSSEWSTPTTFYVNRNRIIYVKEDGKGDGSTWQKAFGKLEDALENASVSDEIWVAKGTYSPSTTIKSYIFKQGIKLYGGFIGNEINRNNRNWSKNATILSGSSNNSTLLIGKNNTSLEELSILDGFTLTQGYAGPETVERGGGGLLLNNFKLIINNCLITKNNAYLIGGGIYSSNSQVDIYNSIISFNHSAGNGAGIYVSGGKVNVYNCLIFKNDASASDNGGIVAGNNQCEIFNTIVCENTEWQGQVSNMSYNVKSHSSYIGDSKALIDKNGLNISINSPCINKGDASYVNDKYMSVDYYGNQRIKGSGVEIGPFELGDITPFPTLPLDKTIIYNNANSNTTLHWDSNDSIPHKYDIEYWVTGKDTIVTSNISTKELTKQFGIGTINWRVRYSGTLENFNWSKTFKFTNSTSRDTIYVNATKNGDGTTWEQAYSSLKNAIKNAQYGDEIWIAKGVYKTSEINNVKENFVITNKISLYGGFNGNETDKSQRKIDLNKTILSGELGDPNKIDDNSNNILTIQGVANSTETINSIIDGIFIEKNNNTTNYFGALLIQNDNPIIQNCVFRYNDADGYNSGIYCELSSPKITNCLFHNNSSSYHGTVLYVSNEIKDTVDISNCSFINNSNRYDDPIISKSWSSNPIILLKNSIFWGNFHNQYYTSTDEITGCTISHCSFERKAHSSNSFIGNPILNNVSNGDYSLAANSPCINSGDNNEIDVATDFALKPRIVGGVIDLGYIESNIPKVQLIEPVKSNILQMFTNKVSTLRWNDTEYLASKKYMTQYWVKGSADTTKTTLCIEQSTPLFTILPYQEYQWRVGVFSEELNDYSWSETESFFTGKGNPIFVKEGATGDGSSWNSAFGSLSSALAIAKNGDQIWVAKGTYYPSATNDRSSSFNISANIQLLGGFAGNESDAFFRNSALNKTIISGNIGSKTDATDNSMQLFKITGTDINQTMTIDGFTISDSYNTNQEFGAFHIFNCSPTISNCIISHNQSKSIAGLLIESGNPTITNSLIVHNVSAEIGCAIKSDINSNPTIINCTIAQNESKGNSAIKGDANVSNSIIYHNLNTLGYISIDKATVTYSCIENIAFGHDNIYADPNFEEQINFTLNPFSPCFNKGSKGVSSPLIYDLGLKNRIAFGQVDMGANEIQTTADIEIIAITPSNQSTQVDINPTIEIKFNTDVKINDASKIFVANRLNSLEQLPTNSSNTLRFKTTTLDFEKLYTLIVESNSYQLTNNELIVGNDTTITFTTRSCQNGVVSVKLANDGKCINNILVVEPTISGDIKSLPTWYIDGDKLPWSGYKLDISEVKANQFVRYTNTDMCGNTIEANLNMSDSFEPIKIVKKWDDVLIINNGDQRFDNYNWTVNGSQISTDQYIQIKSSVDGYVVVSANELKSNCRLFSDSIQFKLDNLSKIEVFPNPVSAMKSITIHSKNQISINAIKLIDMNGSVVSEQIYNQEAQLFDFSKTDVTPGVYFIEINSGNTKTTQKIVVTH